MDKFIPSFISFVEGNFPNFASRHMFIVKGGRSVYPLRRYDNLVFCESSGLSRIQSFLKITKQILRAEKVLLHGLFDEDVVRILALMPWLSKKCYWVIWGGDLYEYNAERRSLSRHLQEYLRRRIIRRIGHLVTYVEGDYQLAVKWYGAVGEYHECIMYTSNIYDAKMFGDPTHSPTPNNSINILVGNSADPSNNHIDTIKRLLPYKEMDIKIFLPLSYGDQEHAAYVAKIGRDWFGDRFVPLTEFMPLTDYQQFLKTIDIAIFNHSRQQAMGNIIALLGLGRKVFLNKRLTHGAFFERMGIMVYDINSFSLEAIPASIRINNARNISSYFSIDTLSKQLRGLFDA